MPKNRKAMAVEWQCVSLWLEEFIHDHSAKPSHPMCDASSSTRRPDVGYVLPHDVRDAWGRIQLQLPLAFAKKILNCRKVFLVEQYVLPKLISAAVNIKAQNIQGKITHRA